MSLVALTPKLRMKIAAAAAATTAIAAAAIDGDETPRMCYMEKRDL